MNIRLKGKYLYYLKYKIKCSIGKKGISKNKKEGDLKTPKGKFKLKLIFYRKDKIKILQTSLKKIAIKRSMGWCDDIKSKKYNKLISFPFKYSAEKLWRKNNIYDVAIVLNYNLNPVKKNKGSAIFLHIAKKNYSATKGCIAISRKDMLILIANLKKNSAIII